MSNLSHLVDIVDPVKVLEAVGLKEGINFYVHGSHLRGQCPVHRGEGFNFAIDLSTGLCSCFSHKCFHKNGRNILTVVAAIFGMKQAISVIESVVKNNPIKIYTKREYQKPTESEVRKHRKNYSDYLTNRGICQDVQDLFECGFHPGGGGLPPRVTLPVRSDTGELIGILGRRTDEGDDKKYYPVSDLFPVGHTLYGLYQALRVDALNEVALLVEGPLDVLKGWEFGCRYTVGAYGSTLSWEQAELLAANVEEVWVFRDGDDAGGNLTKSTLARLGKVLPIYEVPLLGHASDPGGIQDCDDWYECLESRVLV